LSVRVAYNIHKIYGTFFCSKNSLNTANHPAIKNMHTARMNMTRLKPLGATAVLPINIATLTAYERKLLQGAIEGSSVVSSEEFEVFLVPGKVTLS
jgi:hypothetical protein